MLFPVTFCLLLFFIILSVPHVFSNVLFPGCVVPISLFFSTLISCTYYCYGLPESALCFSNKLDTLTDAEYYILVYIL